MGELEESLSHPSRNLWSLPVREDCWSQEATFTLIEAWGQRYLELNRGNLRQKHWQEVAEAVNARHGQIKKARRTDVQCKNRIDTLKKKYKIEKARVLESNESFTSQWPFFPPLDALIGSTMTTAALKKSSPQTPSTGSPMAVPLMPYRRTPTSVAAETVLPLKRPSSMATTLPTDESYFRKNYSAVAAAAAAAAAAETDDEEDEEEELEESKSGGEAGEADGIQKLAKAIDRFAEVYARVESEKQRQMIELEKQRMKFAKELELQRMQMVVELQFIDKEIFMAFRTSLLWSYFFQEFIE
ncbi:hypothetical protein Nepgr_032215 [Nepenthes gracilis]|uniref:Myb/SANT-like DNA-binding domain-containing protein n=1 Tax=Nepenthes gracilis TaxID=150966 RepID=A0AAD3Y5H0_NEPGR|nr:hypothetical protein Nepgr_032215 [Nepenthes gracilis]